MTICVLMLLNEPRIGFEHERVEVRLSIPPNPSLPISSISVTSSQRKGGRKLESTPLLLILFPEQGMNEISKWSPDYEKLTFFLKKVTE